MWPDADEFKWCWPKEESQGGGGVVSHRSRNRWWRRSVFVSSLVVKDWFSDPSLETPQETDGVYPVRGWAMGYGRDISTSGGEDPMLFFLDEQGNIYQSEDGTADPILIRPGFNSSHFGSGQFGGLIVDQKKRLLYPGRRYLGRFDPSIDDDVSTVTLTNGSDAVTKTGGDDFVAADHEYCFMVLSYNTKWYLYRVDNVSSTTALTLYENVDVPSGSYSVRFMKAWKDQWKDFGTALTQTDSDGGRRFVACETYEDTVLFMRANYLTSLNTLTDSITTDASPAFTMPTGFDGVTLHRGTNGILLGYNFQRKGVLVLWDNYSDRSVAPWIDLPDRPISLSKYNGGWLVITAREIYYTNGYSLELLASKMIGMDITPLASQRSPQTSCVIEDDLYFIGDFDLHGKRRHGVYRFNIGRKLLEFIPRESLDVYNASIRSLYYAPGDGSGRVYAGMEDRAGYVSLEEAPAVAAFVSAPVGRGENAKVAQAVKLDIGLPLSYSGQEASVSATVVVKAMPLVGRHHTHSEVKTTQTVANQIVVNESTQPVAAVGDEIEFLEGPNAGYTRNITAKSGSGATVTYTLDRALPALADAGDKLFVSKYQLVAAKAFTSVTEFKPDLLWFDIQNRLKGKKFLVKVEIEGATVPLEVRPIQFVYDDTGIIT